MLFTLLMTLFTILAPQHPTMPAGMSHEEHLKQMAKDEALKKRGAAAMGFDQDAVVHHFVVEPDGGAVELRVKPEAGAATLTAVRAHLRDIAAAFGRGDFSASIATHAEVPAGVKRMIELKDRIRYQFVEAPDGGRVSIRTKDRAALEAIHAFLRYQIAEHHTGGVATR